MDIETVKEALKDQSKLEEIASKLFEENQVDQRIKQKDAIDILDNLFDGSGLIQPDEKELVAHKGMQKRRMIIDDGIGLEEFKQFVKTYFTAIEFKNK